MTRVCVSTLRLFCVICKIMIATVLCNFSIQTFCLHLAVRQKAVNVVIAWYNSDITAMSELQATATIATLLSFSHWCNSKGLAIVRQFYCRFQLFPASFILGPFLTQSTAGAAPHQTIAWAPNQHRVLLLLYIFMSGKSCLLVASSDFVFLSLADCCFLWKCSSRTELCLLASDEAEQMHWDCCFLVYKPYGPESTWKMSSFVDMHWEWCSSTG